MNDLRRMLLADISRTFPIITDRTMSKEGIALFTDKSVRGIPVITKQRESHKHRFIN